MTSWFVYQFNALLKTARWLDHSDQAIAKSFQIAKDILDAETGIRGFLLSNDPRALAPYYSAKSSFDDHLHETSDLIIDNSRQVEAVGQIHVAFARWMEQAAQVVAEAGVQPESVQKIEAWPGEEKARSYFGYGKGSVEIDECRSVIYAFLSGEQALRQKRLEALRRQTPRVLIGGMAISLFLRLLFALALRKLRMVKA